MKFISFNINGIRAHQNQVLFIIQSIHPEIIGLQEIKTKKECFPIETFLKYGYHSYIYGQKQYNGVALLSRVKVQKISRGLFEYDNKQRRMITVELKTKKIKKLLIINIYAPNGASVFNKIKFQEKKLFYQKLYLLLKNYRLKYDNILIMGDMNISPTDLDVGFSQDIIKKWINLKKCSFLPEERFLMDNLFKLGFIDAFRYLYPKKNNFYSWFDYRSCGYENNTGLRIDLFLVTSSLLKYIKSSGILYHLRLMQKPSDHLPIWIHLNI